MLVDIIFILIAALYAASGYRRGFVRSVSELVGVLVGAAVALIIIRTLFSSIEPTSASAISGMMLGVGFLTVLMGAGLGHGLGHLVAKAMSKPRENDTTRRIDGAAGSVFSAASIAAVGWILAFGASVGALPASGVIAESKVLTGIDKVVPDAADNTLMTVSTFLLEQGFGRFITPVTEVPLDRNVPSDAEAMESFAAAKAADSVVRIDGKSPCHAGGIVGTGFIVGPELVMTNAHVVAGLERPTFTVGGKSSYGKVVHIDAARDLAVVHVKGLQGDPLTFDMSARRGTTGVIVGYPSGGPYDARSAQVDRAVTMRAADIYGDGHHERDVFLVNATVRGGNSGGPMLSAAGDVLGVVYAKSTVGRESGFVLSSKLAAQVLEEAQGKTAAVTTAPVCN